jgi:CRISPR/Cas system CSM-associated protein Csm3 (group 7 of RAMP superfamily)
MWTEVELPDEPLAVSFTILGRIERPQTIAGSSAIRDVRRLRKTYGLGLWRKRKGFARVRLEDGTICRAEIHWYEAHGIGKKELKLKRRLEG